MWRDGLAKLVLPLLLLVFVISCSSSCGYPALAPNEDLPEFPWPPPQSSASQEIPAEFLTNPEGGTTLGDVADRLAAGLQAAAYPPGSYYHVPGGFALVTGFEQITEAAAPVAAEYRFRMDFPPPTDFSLWAYLRSLFKAEQGHYRVMAFLITDVPYAESAEGVTPETARDWLRAGLKHLPPTVAALPFTDEHRCDALIYEFVRETEDHDAVQALPSANLARAHLKLSGFWSSIGR